MLPRTLNKLGFIAGLSLAAGCGGDDDTKPAADATGGVDGASPDAAPSVCAEAPGVACVWLGSGIEGYNGDGLHRLRTDIYWSMDMIFTSDNTAWFIDWNNHLVRQVLADQTVKTVVGWNDPIFPGDGTGDMTEKSEDGAEGLNVRLNHPTELVQGADGLIYMMAWHNHKLRTIDPATGKVHIVAGAGAGFAGDGGPMGKAIFKQPKALTRDDAGNLYVGDQQNFRVRKIDVDGNISTIVGVGTQGSMGDGGPALQAQLNWEVGSNPEPSGGLAVKGGKLYIADTLSHTIRVVDFETGNIEHLAGTGEPAFSGDDGPALDAKLNFPRELEIGPEGDLYIADTDNHAIRAINLETNVIRTVAGVGGELGRDEVDGKPAIETHLRRPFGLEFDADGNLYIMDTMNSRILKVKR